MKKNYLPLLVVIALTSSCKKNYTCHCNTSSWSGGTGPGEMTETITANSSADALNKCNADAKSYAQGGTFNCTME